jgi:type IV secretory pathway VirB6-like protein
MIFSVLDGVDAALRSGVIQPAYEALSDLVAGPLRSGMVLLTASFGYKMLKGSQAQGVSPTDIWWLLVKMGVVLELLLNWGTFNTWILEVLWDSYDNFADVLATQLGKPGGLKSKVIDYVGLAKPSLNWVASQTMISVKGHQLDLAFAAQIDKALKMLFGTPSIFFYDFDIKIPLLGIPTLLTIPIPMPNLIPNLAGLIALVMTVVLFASVFVVLLLSRLGMISCLAVAPIFIALSMFEHTRTYTDSWFRGLLGFLLTPLLLVIVLMVADACTGFVSNYPTSGDAIDLFTPLIAFVLIYYALAKSVASVPQFASGMVGSLLANIGDGAAHALVGGIQNAAAGAVKGFAMGGPAGAAAGAAKGAASAMR